eukprot:scaffold10025_cov119-Isochrysis_galbana.AAC.7
MFLLYIGVRNAAGVSSASSAYSSLVREGGKLSRRGRGPLYPLPHLVGGDGSILSGVSSRASLTDFPGRGVLAIGGRENGPRPFLAVIENVGLGVHPLEVEE